MNSSNRSIFYEANSGTLKYPLGVLFTSLLALLEYYPVFDDARKGGLLSVFSVKNPIIPTLSVFAAMAVVNLVLFVFQIKQYVQTKTISPQILSYWRIFLLSYLAFHVLFAIHFFGSFRM